MPRKLQLLLSLTICLFLAGNLSAQRKFKIQPKYKKFKTDPDDWYPDKVNINVGFEWEDQKLPVSAKRTSNGRWEFSQNGAAYGKAKLYRNSRGLGWEMDLGGEKLDILLSEDPDDSNDPRSPVITFRERSWKVRNYEPDENSEWEIYTGEQVLMHAINNWDYHRKPQKWDDTPEWKITIKEDRLSPEERFAFVFLSLMGQNVRYSAALL